MLDLREVVCQPVSSLGTPVPVSLQFVAGTFNALAGPRGSGRGAFLRLLGLLDAPLSGEVFLEGRPTAGLPELEREQLRNLRCGYLFAAPFLLPAMTVLENVAMPLFKISQLDPNQARARTELLLAFVDLLDEAREPAESLNLYQQHCVSLARALVNHPALLVVESLDASLPALEAAHFAALLRAAADRFGVTVIASVPMDFPVERSDRIILFGQGDSQEEPAKEGPASW